MNCWSSEQTLTGLWLLAEFSNEYLEEISYNQKDTKSVFTKMNTGNECGMHLAAQLNINTCSGQGKDRKELVY